MKTLTGSIFLVALASLSSMNAPAWFDAESMPAPMPSASPMPYPSSFPTSTTGPVPKADPALATALVKEVKPYVRTVTRPLTVWHYTHRSDVKLPLKGGVPQTAPNFAAYANMRAKGFYRMSPRNSSMMGTGLYLANDPVATRGYGGQGSSWALVQLEFLPGAKFIDVTYGATFTPQLTSKLKAYGCPAPSLYELVSSDNNKFCQSLRIAIADSPELGATALRYQYDGGIFPMCKFTKTQGHAHAFNAWSLKGFNVKAIVGYVSDVSRDPVELDRQKLIQAIWETTQQETIDIRQYPYPELKGSKPSISIPAYIKERFEGCGRYPEDKTNPNEFGDI